MKKYVAGILVILITANVLAVENEPTRASDQPKPDRDRKELFAQFESLLKKSSIISSLIVPELNRVISTSPSFSDSKKAMRAPRGVASKALIYNSENMV